MYWFTHVYTQWKLEIIRKKWSGLENKLVTAWEYTTTVCSEPGRWDIFTLKHLRKVENLVEQKGVPQAALRLRGH